MLFSNGPNEDVPGPSALILSPDSIQHNSQNSNMIANQQMILENQQIIVNNQLKLMQALAKMQTGVDYLMESNMFGNIQPNDKTNILLKPVDSLSDLNALEESLKEPTAMEKYITNMSFICGTDGKSTGMDSCYKLVDFFITREFMHLCSWTGNSKVTDENDSLNAQFLESPGKIPLKFYTNFRSLFLKLIRLADKDFTEVKCDEFFKRVMKNSKARLQAKTASKHKNRPNNLKYKSRKTEISTGNGQEEPTEKKTSESAQAPQS
ncbi:uncharacterized protein LOC135705589 [Ochlerotatus camptorhynchus]|uniref:uncharacterized protein LOC135705589 n=1 Tax=Ochlerotatus camptorhynchus TaxID=644619 RepID=UPI0031D58B89